ncbi:DUF4861 family protein [Flavobacterium pallidum]|uniref:DUF4861 family protein n=1 Tax=Flavobacterium pallidum TaxID=2172098 RepID=UPI0015E80EB3|nr:DUF4861 family protein [Flavobacterium pallidum]
MPKYLLLLILLGFKIHAQPLKVVVKNPLGFDRNDVTAISREQLEFWLKAHDKRNFRIKMEGTEAYLPVQWTDYDQDGKYDAVLFQANVPANATVNYYIVPDSLKRKSQSQRAAYAQFSPERGEGLAWENDKVAFCIYGKSGKKSSNAAAFSSGVDLWLKKVEYSIIENWYAKSKKQPGYYHEDHGEGYDGYDLGDGRGVGGSGLFVKDSLHIPDGFSSYKIWENGPLRVTFEVKYKRWSRFWVEETKIISLDMGSNFSKFEVYFTANTKAPDYSVGISLHDNKGKARLEKEVGWARYWEPIDDSYLGEAIIMEPKIIADMVTYTDAEHDRNHLFVVTKPRDQLTYYTGFSWLKSGQVKNVEGWDILVQQQILKLNNPLEVSVLGN